MPDLRELFAVGAAGFDSRVRAVPRDRWSAPTPCAEWSVRDVVSHLTAEQLWVPHLLGGEQIEDVGGRYDGDVLGDDPVVAWTAASRASTAAWEDLDDLDRPVHLSRGETPARDYAEEMVLDLTVHSWDLARGAGLDEELDPRLVEHVLGYASTHAEELRGSGMFADPVEAGSSSAQDRLLALLGRRP